MLKIMATSNESEIGSENSEQISKKFPDGVEKDSNENVVNNDGSRVRTGRCKWFNVLKGFGFIVPEDGGQEVFVHQSVIQMSGFRSLAQNEVVEFECKPSDKGFEATRVSGPDSEPCHGSDFKPKPKKRYRKFRCYNCGEFANHLAKDCSQGILPKRCHFCKEGDHLVAECPTKLSQSQENSIKNVSNDDENDENIENE